MSSSAQIARSTGVLAAATGVSRVLGFVRDILMAGLFGTTPQAQAFVVAFRLPNLLRDLVGEGAVTSAFVPVLTWYRAKGDLQGFWRLSQALAVRLLVLLSAIGLAGTLAAPWIVRLIAPGFVHDPEKFALTVWLTRILFPFITLVGLWAYFMGLLNSLRHFGMPALGPATLNLAMIAACLWFVPRTSPGVLALAIGVMAGGVVQLLIQIPVAVRLGFRWQWRWKHPASQEIMRLLGPRMLGSGVYQANVLIDTALASLSAIVGDGAVAALYFANRLVQLPLALFGTASAQASLPSMAEQAAAKDMPAFSSTLHKVLRMVGFVVIPSSVGLVVLAQPIVSGLFQRGAFDARAAAMTSQALACYALGLLAYSMNKVLTSAFYALHDTWTPVKLAAETLAISLLLSLALMWPLQVSGLALAAAISNSVNAWRLTQRLERRLGRPLIRPLLRPLGRMLAASLLMGAACWGLLRLGVETLQPAIGLPLVVGGGLLCYAAACRALHIQEFTSARTWLAKLSSPRLSVGE